MARITVYNMESKLMNGQILGSRGFIGGIAALAVGFGIVAVAGDAPSTVQGAVCQSRSSCRVIETLDAGRSDGGAKLNVLHVVLGDDQPSPESDADLPPCRPYPEEYWLQEVVQDSQANYRRLFAFCNDGYGAAGVGEDVVTVGPNRITLERAGGSAWRWEFAATYQIIPERPLSRRERSYHTASGGCLETETDFRTLTQRGWFDPPPPEEALDEETAFCDQKTAPSQFLGLPRLESGDDDFVAKLEKQAAGLGDCALVLNAGSGENTGFVIHGRPDPLAGTEVRVLAPTANTLLVQVRDPGRTPAVSANWIHDDRLELWFGPSLYDGYPRAERQRELRQFGIRLADGTVFGGYGKPKALPAVRRWQRGDARLILVDWSDTDLEPYAVTVVYGQGDGRQQGAMIATSALRYGNPDTLGQFWAFPANCELREGVLNVGELRSEAAARMENEDTDSP